MIHGTVVEKDWGISFMPDIRNGAMAQDEIKIKGCRPWESSDAAILDEKPYEKDSVQEMNMCLNCPMNSSDCVDCIGKLKAGRLESNLDRFIMLIKMKYTRERICSEMHISRATYFNYKKAALVV